MSTAIDGAGLPVPDLPGKSVPPLIAGLASHGVRGGAAYDALVAATALHHDAALVTADHRARATYDAVGVEIVTL